MEKITIPNHASKQPVFSSLLIFVLVLEIAELPYRIFFRFHTFP